MSGGSKSQTVGYRYYMGLHMGICHGPVDSLLEIRVGDRTAWSGNVTGNTALSIDAPNLFGGEEREGGVKGTLDVMMGGSSQAANSYLTSVQGGPQPGYRGFLGFVFRRGLVSCNNPYVKPWAGRVRRILSGWDGAVWYSAKASLDLGSGVQAMNPAHIVYQALTDRSRGRGIPSGRLDLTSFAAAADTFYAEGMHLCFTWNKPDQIQNFVQQVCDHAGASVVEDPTTGLIRMKAIRADYSVGSLQLFSRALGNVIAVENFDRAAVTGTTNEVTVQYVDQATGKNGSVTVQHLASIQAQGKVIPGPKQYTGCPTAALATRLALRDLNVSTAGLARVRFRATRAAYNVLPGDVIAFSEPEYETDLMPLRVGKVDYGSLQNGEITIEAVQDVFGLPLTTYLVPQAGQWTEPDRTPQAAPYTKFFEVPYREIARGLGTSAIDDIDPNAAFLAAAIARPSGYAINYELHTRIGAAAYERADLGEWCPHGAISAALSKTGTSVTLTGFDDLDQVQLGTSAMIDNEIVEVTSIDLVTGVVGIARGCDDTVPATHSSGARLWFFEVYSGLDPKEYATSEVVDAKARTVTTSGLLSEGSAPGGTVTMAQRAYRPYPPGDLKFNTARYPATIAGQLVVSWVHRDRTLQADQLFDTLDGSIGPELGVTYTVRLYDQGGTLRRTVTGLTGTSYTWVSEGPDSLLNGDSALLHLNGTNGSTTIVDEIGNTWTCSGNAAISTAQFKFGAASLAMDGSGDYISCPDAGGFYFGAGQFTVECFVRFNTAATNGGLVSKWSATGAAQAWALYLTSGQIGFRFRDTGGTYRDVFTAWAPSANTWYHVAATRDASGLVRVYIDGASVASGTFTQTVNDGTTGPRIGQVEGFAGTFDVNGYIDEVRITRGIARYTGASFTVPTGELTPAPGLNNPVRATVEAIRGGLGSWQLLDHTAAR